jgi:hypothetical protein
LGPIPNPQSPIPNPQLRFYNINISRFSSICFLSPISAKIVQNLSFFKN